MKSRKIVYRVLTLYMVDSGLIPDTIYGFLTPQVVNSQRRARYKSCVLSRCNPRAPPSEKKSMDSISRGLCTFMQHLCTRCSYTQRQTPKHSSPDYHLFCTWTSETVMWESEWVHHLSEMWNKQSKATQLKNNGLTESTLKSGITGLHKLCPAQVKVKSVLGGGPNCIWLGGGHALNQISGPSCPMEVPHVRPRRTDAAFSLQ